MDVFIFASIDANGIIGKYKHKVKKWYQGLDPFKRGGFSDGERQTLKNTSPYLLGFTGKQTKTVSNYTRLISSRQNTRGYEIKDGCTETYKEEPNKKFLTKTYNLHVAAHEGDRLHWWGHSLSPGLENPAVIWNIIPKGAGLGEITRARTKLKNVTGYENRKDYRQGFYTDERSVFHVSCPVEGREGQIIEYEIELLIMSSSVSSDSTLCYPAIKVVVDPTIVIV